MKWQLQTAKAKFSEMMRRAASEGPQIVTYRGEEAAVLLSAAAYRDLVAAKPNFVDWLRDGPKFDDDIVDAMIERPRFPDRAVDL